MVRATQTDPGGRLAKSSPLRRTNREPGGEEGWGIRQGDCEGQTLPTGRGAYPGRANGFSVERGGSTEGRPRSAGNRKGEAKPGDPRREGRAARTCARGGVEAVADSRPTRPDSPGRHRVRTATGRTDGRGGSWGGREARSDIQTRPAVGRRWMRTDRPRSGGATAMASGNTP